MGWREGAERAPAPAHPNPTESDSEVLCADADMQASADAAKASQTQLELTMAERLDQHLRSNGKQFIGAVVTPMVSGLREQVAGIAAAQKAINVELERVGGGGQ